MQSLLPTIDLQTARGLEHRPPVRSRAFTSAWLLLISVTVAASLGCTPVRQYFRNGFKVGPNFQRPTAPVAGKWIDSEDKRVHSVPEDISRWWMVFNDPVINGLVDTAYRQNLTLREAGFRVLQARAQLSVARGNFFPQTQNASGGYLRESISKNNANRGFVQTTFFDQWAQGFNLAWEIDFWGKFRRAIESANENLNVSVENYDEVLVTLLGDVAATYVQIRTIERQIEYTRTNVELQTQTLAIAVARFQGGNISDLDVEQAKSVLAQTEAQIPALQISLRQANNALCILMGIPPEDLQNLIGAGDIPTAPAEVAIGIPADLLRQRPDVREAERAAAAQSAQIGIAESDFYPSISLVGTLGWQSQGLHNLFTPGSLESQIGPTYQWNLLNYGRILNNVRAQEALFHALVVEYQNTVLTAAQEVENGLVTFLKSQEEVKYQAESVVAAKKAVDLALVQYKGGLVDFNRVATLEVALVQQQDTLAQARGQIATGLINVYRALGGGWEIRLAPPGTMMTPATMPVLPAAPPSQPPAEIVPALKP